MDIDISVIIPVYNTELYLHKCLSSILDQPFTHLEVILVNDGSTDASNTILEHYKCKDSRVIVLNQENQGAWAARNNGLKIAQGEYILFVDSDDEISPYMLNDLYQQAKAHSSDIVLSMYKRVTASGKVSSVSSSCLTTAKEELFQALLSSKILPTVWAKLIRRQLFIDNAITFPKLDYFEDIIVAVKLFYYAQSISVINKAYYHWYIRDGSATRQSTLKHIADKFSMLDSIQQFLIEENIYNQYKAAYLCQCARRIITEVQVVKQFADSKTHDRLETIYNAIDQRQLLDNNNLKLLSQCDNALYRLLRYNLIDKTNYRNLNRIELEKKLEICSLLKLKSEMQLEAVQTIKGFRFLSDSEKEPLKKLKHQFNNKRCFILGNGPSLNQCDLGLLNNEFTFSSNAIISNITTDGFTPYFYIADETAIINNQAEHIRSASIPYKFLPGRYIDKIGKNNNIIYFTEDTGFKQKNHPDYSQPRFSKNCTDVIFSGASVNHLCLQLAFYLGFHEVYLIGMDFTFDMENLSINQIIRGDSIEKIINDFSFAHNEFEQAGKKIYNASKGGNINLFERVDFESLFI